MDESKFHYLREKLIESLEGCREIQDEEIYQSIDELILESGVQF